MFGKIRYYRELSRLQRQKRRISDFYSEKARAAKEQGAAFKERERLHDEERLEIDPIDDEIGHLQTAYLIQRADELLIPTPPFNQQGPDWIEAPSTGRWQLSLSARASLRDKIHTEEKGVWERRTNWLVLLIGLIGAATGLASVLKP